MVTRVEHEGRQFLRADRGKSSTSREVGKGLFIVEVTDDGNHGMVEVFPAERSPIKGGSPIKFEPSITQVRVDGLKKTGSINLLKGGTLEVSFEES